MKRFTAVTCAAMAALAFGPARAEFQIRNNDRVVFLGDSITEQRLYTTYVEAYAITRHPGWWLRFRNVGWGGDTSWLRQRAHPDEGQLFRAEGEDLANRVKDSVAKGLGRDVLPLKPTFVTVKFGMNDHSYQKFRPDIFRAYTNSQAEIASVLGKNGARVTFLTPQPIEERRPDPDHDDRNQSLRRFSDGLGEVARATGSGYVDQFAPFMKLMLDARASDPKAFIGGGDAVHPGPSGQLLMAWAVLRGLGATAPVSSAEIDAASKSVKAESCQVTGVTVEGATLKFDRRDGSLPMPIDARAEDALKRAPVLEELSRLMLTVKGLKPGTYEVLIDDQSVAMVDADVLAKGWNYSNNAGPITRQAREVLAGVFKKNDLYFNRWRDVQLHRFPGWANGTEVESRREAELRRLDEAIAAAEKRIEELNMPQTHRFTVRPAQP